jgi:myo-inositol 2-dehydrogenase/D-chiro-inositol 1-dehydrogenase
MIGSDDLLVPTPVTSERRNRLDDVAVAVIGCGLHSTTAILPSLRHAGVRLTAVCDLDAERAENARRQFGAQFAYRSTDDLLSRDDLDAIVVVGPPELHVSAGIAALQSGHHVFIEKPPGTSLAEAVSIQNAARGAGKQVMVGFMKRNASAYRLVKQVVNAPEFGELTSVEMTYSHWPVTGLRMHLVDMSIHALDTVRWLVGAPVRMSAYKRTIRDNHALALMLEHTGGAVSSVNLSAFAPGVQERLVVTGEGAVIRVDNLIRLTYVRQAHGAPDERANARVIREWTPEFSLPDTENDVNVIQGYATELVAFADAIREGDDVSPSIDDGVAAMKVVEAIIEAPDGLSLCDLQ